MFGNCVLCSEISGSGYGYRGKKEWKVDGVTASLVHALLFQ